ncbi:hypothetical protein BDW22DRAFT_1424569 [Trametopsis cervina]|nr:hypothetical protein BDW22DRAFT_1424569 [Trametopsis cervina]
MPAPYKESVPTIMGSSHTPPTKFPQSIALAWERDTSLMNPYPVFLPGPPPSHLHLPMGSTPGIAPDDHFLPPISTDPHQLSRSNSPHSAATLESIVHTSELPRQDDYQHAGPSMSSSSTPSSQPVNSIQSILASAKSPAPSVNGHSPPPAWSPSMSGHPPRETHGALPGPPPAIAPRTSSKRKLDASGLDDANNKIRRVLREHVSQNPARLRPMTTVLCLHAAVAQKSYGTEKRFLCPPPVVHIEGPLWNMKQQQLSMTVVSEGRERSLEQRAPVDHNLSANFKFLHVTGSAKSKSFQLSLDIAEPPPAPTDGTEPGPGRVWASFESAPVTIISKPSKKTAKTRNIASCILAGGPVSLFNRINSQTVRTKYMTVDGGAICASNNNWSAFTVNVVRSSQGDPPPALGPNPVTYGSEIMLVDQTTGTQSGLLQIRKVDKGRVVPDDGGPVSQMQKIALLRVNPDGSHHYLSAAGPPPGSVPAVPPAPGLPNTAPLAHPLMYQAARVREEVKDGHRIVTDEVDDYLCWTIVGISKFQYTFFDAFNQSTNTPEFPITPFPTLYQAPILKTDRNKLELIVANFFYEHPKHHGRQTLDIYIGNVGPLPVQYWQPGAPHMGTAMTPFVQAIGPDGVAREQEVDHGIRSIQHLAMYAPGPAIHTTVEVEMPPIGDLLKSIQDDLEPPTPEELAGGGERSRKDKGTANEPPIRPDKTAQIAGRSLPLLFVRPYDGVGYHSGRAIACENVFQTMDLAGMAGPGAGAGLDTDWLAAAQAAAAVDNGLHGWTMRVI